MVTGYSGGRNKRGGSHKPGGEGLIKPGGGLIKPGVGRNKPGGGNRCSVQRLSARFARGKIHFFLTCFFDIDFGFEKSRDIARSTRNVLLHNICRNQLLGSYMIRFYAFLSFWNREV